MGDPLLTLAGHPLAPGTAHEGDAPSSQSFGYIVEATEPACGLEGEPGGFEEYRKTHPEFIYEARL